MKRPSNKELKAALLEARSNIKSGKHGGYICNALPNDDAGYYLRDFIGKAIGDDYDTLGSWVWHNHIGIDQPFPSVKDMKVYRLRWIDYMLEGL